MTRQTARIAIPVGLIAFLLASLLACCDRPEAPACLRAAGADTVVSGAFDEPAERLTIADGIEVVLRADVPHENVRFRPSEVVAGGRRIALEPRFVRYTLADGRPRLPQSNRKVQQTVENIRTSAKFLGRLLASDLTVLG